MNVSNTRLKVTLFKGQNISKDIFHYVTSPKKLLLALWIISCSFLEEVMLWEVPFEIFWPSSNLQSRTDIFSLSRGPLGFRGRWCFGAKGSFEFFWVLYYIWFSNMYLQNTYLLFWTKVPLVTVSSVVSMLTKQLWWSFNFYYTRNHALWTWF